MRKVIMLQIEKPKLNGADVKQRVAEIVQLFDNYLDEYPIKSARSKHAVMGPVAKVLDRAQAGQWDAEPLTGYALRMHEMNPKTGGRISQTAVANLRDGTDKLLLLCRDVPVTALANTVEQIDYSLYFQRKVKSLQWLEVQQKALVKYLTEKYHGDDASFCKAWGLKKTTTIAAQYFFGVKSPTYRNGNDVLRTDMDEFYAWMKEIGENPDAVVEEETLEA